jgi:cell wall assembly regulator SMI1
VRISCPLAASHSLRVLFSLPESRRVRWVPFSDFYGSPRLILDLHPGRNGTYGQVWQDWPGCDREDDRTVIAPTLAEFSTELLPRLTTGSVVVDDDGTLSFPRAGGYWLV